MHKFLFTNSVDKLSSYCRVGLIDLMVLIYVLFFIANSIGLMNLWTEFVDGVCAHNITHSEYLMVMLHLCQYSVSFLPCYLEIEVIVFFMPIFDDLQLKTAPSTKLTIL